MKIICVDARALYFEYNGISRYLRELLVFILEQSRDYKFILISNKKITFEHTKKEHYEIVVDSKFSFLPGTLWLHIRGNALAKEFGSEVFFGPAHMLPFFKDNSIKYLLTVHDVVHKLYPETMQMRNYILTSLFFKKSLKNADKIITMSETTKLDLIHFFSNKYSKKIETVYSGKSLQDLNVTKIVNYNYLFILGSLEPRKNVFYTIKMFRELVKCKPDLKLVITGAQGWKNQNILNYIDENNLNNLVMLTGYLTNDEIISYLSNCEAFLFPSLYEGFGLPLLEAEGKAPTIVSDISVFRELGNHFENIHFCDFVIDTQQSALNVLEILNNKPKILKFKTDEDRLLFSWEYSAKKMIEIFSEQ